MEKFISRVIVLVAALVFLNLTTFLVLESNLFAEVYPPEADSLSIPIAGTLIFSVISLCSDCCRSVFSAGCRAR